MPQGKGTYGSKVGRPQEKPKGFWGNFLDDFLGASKASRSSTRGTGPTNNLMRRSVVDKAKAEAKAGAKAAARSLAEVKDRKAKRTAPLKDRKAKRTVPLKPGETDPELWRNTREKFSKGFPGVSGGD